MFLWNDFNILNLDKKDGAGLELQEKVELAPLLLFFVTNF